MRYILLILSFAVSGLLNAQMVRIYFSDKGEIITGDLSSQPVYAPYLDAIRSEVDSVWMTSSWLNYALVECKGNMENLTKFSFVKSIEQVVPMQSISLQENNFKTDSVSPEALDRHRQWQLDTLGYPYFKNQSVNGEGIVIAIIDAGFTSANESKAFSEIFASKRVLRTWDFIENDSNVYRGSYHGTAVWSCIAGNMDSKPTGLATGASFILLRSEDQKTETMADEDRWIQAIEKAYEWGADIVNSSVGFTNILHTRDQLNGQTLISKAAQIATDKGMMVVVSAGNEWITLWKTLSVPADAEGVVAVGGIDKQGNHSYFSSVGPTADGRTKPDVVAPGTCVIAKGNEFTMGSGTSYAAPLVTGYLACMLQLKGKQIFTKDSLKLYSSLYPYFDYVFGYGVPFAPSQITLTDKKQTQFAIPDIDKQKRTISNNIVFKAMESKGTKTYFLKIIGSDGKIKFSKSIHLNGSEQYKIPITRRKTLFNYSKYFNPQPDDKWIFREGNCYFEY